MRTGPGTSTPPAQGEDHEGDHPGQAGPRQQDDRDATGVLQHVGGEHESDGGHIAPRPGEPEGPAQVEGAGPGGEEQTAHPQSLGDPQGHVELGHRPVEGTHRQQVPDVLVGHRAQGHPGIPLRRSLANVATGIEVEIGLGVVGDHPRPGDQHGEEGQDGERRVIDRGPQPARRAQRPVERPDPTGGPVRRRDEGRRGIRHEYSVV